MKAKLDRDPWVSSWDNNVLCSDTTSYKIVADKTDKGHKLTIIRNIEHWYSHVDLVWITVVLHTCIHYELGPGGIDIVNDLS